MFPSVCALRSTQCAALIALAAAAGIVRVPGGSRAHVDSRPADPEAKATLRTTRADETAGGAVHVDRATHLTALLAIFGYAGSADSNLTKTGVDAAAIASALDFTRCSFGWAPVGPPARSLISSVRHFFPYAVGPPARVRPMAPGGVLAPPLFSHECT